MQITLSSPYPVGYSWTWATGALRTAQTVSASQIGQQGFQTDIALAYVLVSVSPTVWGRIDDPTFGSWKYISSTLTAGFTATGCSWGTANVGSFVSKTLAGTSKGEAIPRYASTVVAALAGSTFYSRSGAAQQAVITQGYRLRGKIVTDVVSTNMKWFIGVTGSALGAPTSVLTPQSQTECLLIGRDTQANMQIFYNDGAGSSTPVDCGASFPSITTNIAVDFEFYIPTGAATGAFMVTNINTGVVFSASFSTDIPTSGSQLLPCIYVTNGTDATQVAVDVAWFGYQTKEV